MAVRSTDGGWSFGPAVTVTALRMSPVPGMRAPALPSAEVDAAGRIWVAWQDCRFRPACGSGGPNDIVLATSADGLTWSRVTRVPTWPRLDGLTHFVPGLAVDPSAQGSAGRLALAFYALTPRGCVPADCRVVPMFVSSSDAGRTWSPPQTLIPNEGQWNVMSVSLLRLADGRIALLHLVNNEGFDSRPRIRFSSDEAKTWSTPVDIIPEPGYYVVNNDRLVQLRSGRLIVPASRHQHVMAGDPPKGTYLPGTLSFWLSDDRGATWRQSAGGVYVSPVPGSKSGLQEPGLIELADGRTDRRESLFRKDEQQGWVFEDMEGVAPPPGQQSGAPRGPGG